MGQEYARVVTYFGEASPQSALRRRNQMWTLLKSIATAGLIGFAALLAQIAPATAADIYDKYGYDKYGPRSSSPYDDPRYADIYSHPAAPAPRYGQHSGQYSGQYSGQHSGQYSDPYSGPYSGRTSDRYDERPHAYQDDAPPVPRDRYGYLRPIRPPHQHDAQPGCLPHGEIRRSLVSEGWRDFQDFEPRGDIAVVRARRPNGQLYSLKVNRCSGDIVHARPLEERPVPYAYRQRHEGRTY